jgi:hypothetical protein
MGMLEKADLRAVEVVAAPGRFLLHDGQIVGNGLLGMMVFFEAIQLGVIIVAPGFSAQDGLGQQAFTPTAKQTLAVDIFGVNGPQAHKI